MDAKKDIKTIKVFWPGIVSSEVKSHANDPFVVKKVEEATKTLQRVGFPNQNKSDEK